MFWLPLKKLHHAILRNFANEQPLCSSVLTYCWINFFIPTKSMVFAEKLLEMKFRRLSQEELAEMETEFVRFLAANTVTGEDWEKLKEQNPEKAEQLIALFSDIVFEKIINDIKYLEFKTPSDIKTFYCQEEKIHMIGLRIDGNSSIDFTQNQSPEQMLSLLQLSEAKLQMYQGEKAYKKDRAQELFDMMQNGALISKDGQLYKTLAQLRG